MAPKKTTKKRFDLRCPDCDFVAAHPMGLGRHRSTRHGMISKRQSRAGASGASGGTGAWITRQQAADTAGVHYNTVRQWERTGVLRRGSRPGARETLVSSADVARLAATRGGRAALGGGLSAGDVLRLAALERGQRDLADGLERLAASLRASVAVAHASSATAKPGRPPGGPAKAAKPGRPPGRPAKTAKTAKRATTRTAPRKKLARKVASKTARKSARTAAPKARSKQGVRSARTARSVGRAKAGRSARVRSSRAR